MARSQSTPAETVVLAEPFTFTRPMAFMLPVRIAHAPDGRQLAHPAPFNTSGDLGGMLATDGFRGAPGRHR